MFECQEQRASVFTSYGTVGFMAIKLARALLVSILGLACVAATSSLSWQPWKHLPAVFDLVGPRSDGKLVAAAGGQLFLVTRDGTITPFADGSGGYHAASGPESYIALSPGLHVSAASCDFARDDLFVLRPGNPLGITRVDAGGHATNFADVTGVDTLNGIVFDTVGRFDHRLLVTGPHNQHSTVLAIDCKGGIVPVTDSAPPLEGGLAVAPLGFGTHAGELIAPDENSGMMLAISATGHSSVLVASGIPHGGDIGVESAAFVPPGFGAGGTAYVADRATDNNPHAGTDTILRLTAADLTQAGVREGDLLVAAEGGGLTIDVRCSTTCTSTTIVPTGTSAHIEGHLLMVADQPQPTPTPLPAVTQLGSTGAQLLFRVVVGILVVAALLLVALRMRWSGLRRR
jgi:hypothetical protein